MQIIKLANKDLIVEYRVNRKTGKVTCKMLEGYNPDHDDIAKKLLHGEMHKNAPETTTESYVEDYGVPIAQEEEQQVQNAPQVIQF